MSAIPFVCWKWRGRGHKPGVVKYTAQHVNVLASMLRRLGGHRLVCVTDDAGGISRDVEVITLPPEIAALDRYYPKLWGFSWDFAQIIGQRFASIDLDVVLLRDPAPLLDHPAPFVIWDQARAELYNSSFYILSPAARTEVWERFTPQAAAQAEAAASRWTGDQSWIGHVLGPGEATYSEADGLIQYRPLRHRAAPPDNMIAGFMCGPYSPDTEARVSQWVKDAWQ